MSGSKSVITPLWLSESWKSFLYNYSLYSCYLFLISSASLRSIPFLCFIVPIFAWNIPLVSLIFLKRYLVFLILFFPLFLCIDHWGRLSYLSLLFFGTLNSNRYETQVCSLGREDPLVKEMAAHFSTLAWKIPWTEEPGRLQFTGSHRIRHNWVTSLSLSLSFSPLPLASVLYSALFKASSDNPFCLFLYFFFPLGMVLITASCTMSWTSIHSSSGTLPYLILWLYVSLLLYNHKGFDFSHTWMG